MIPPINRWARRAFDWLHEHPELSGAEERTASYAAERLVQDGWTVRTGVGGHGVVAQLRNGSGGHVGLRTELDALAHRSEAGALVARHSCGHDLHLACVLGAAHDLAAARSKWSGTVTVVAQPAEETLVGAAAMIADDVFSKGVPDVLLAQHCAPLPAGYLAHCPGPVFAGGRVLRVSVRAAGGHAAGAGHISPVVTLAAMIGRLQDVVAGETGPAEPAVLNVGALDAPEPPGVVPSRVGFEVSLRAMNSHGLDRLEHAVRRVVRAEADASGHCTAPDVEVVASSSPVVNETALTATVAAAHRGALGDRSVLRWVPSMATEDFPELAAGTRPHYWILGCADPVQWASATGDLASRLASIPGNHSPDFVVDPRAVDVGVEAMTSAALAVLGADVDESLLVS